MEDYTSEIPLFEEGEWLSDRCISWYYSLILPTNIDESAIHLVDPVTSFAFNYFDGESSSMSLRFMNTLCRYLPNCQ
jgi:hypothetical protein